MIKLFSGKNLFTCALILAIFTVPKAYSQKKADEPVSKDAINLQYNYAVGNSVKYFADSKIVQTMDVNGQSMLVNISVSMGCKVKSTGKQGENLNIEITVDSLVQNIESPQGSSGGNINDVKGKLFNTVISPSGKILDLTEASKIVYNVEGSGESNLGESFLNYFPTLPKGPVKIGDSWVSNDTVNSKTSTNTVWMPVEANSKLEGIEKINGIDCARITAELKGTRKMSTQTQGMEIFTNGPFTGTQTILFAIKEGYFIKESVITKMTGTIEIPDQSMSFPVVMDVTSTNEIVK